MRLLTLLLAFLTPLALHAQSEDAAVANSLESRAALSDLAAARGYAVQIVSPMLKLRPEQLPPAPARTSLDLHAARGEAESAQLLITPLDRDLSAVAVSAALSGPEGPAPTITLHRTGYVPVDHPTAVSFKTPGRYPDPLFPPEPFDVPLGQSQSVWLTVSVPADAEPGQYSGSITVHPAGAEPTTFPLTLTVHCVSLPARSFLKSLVLVYDGIPFYGDKWPAALDSLFADLLRCRITPTWLSLPNDSIFTRDASGICSASWDKWDAAAEGWMARGATTFWLPYELLAIRTDIPDQPALWDEATQKLRLLDEHLVARGWDRLFYVYSFDEPPPAQIPSLDRYCAFVHERAPHPQFIMTSAHRALQGTGDIWVPHIHELAKPDFEAFMARQVMAGDQFWSYSCMGTRWSQASDIWRIDWYGSSHRSVGWTMFKYGCEGYLYWNASYWYTGSGESLHRFDPLSDPAIINDTSYPDGHCNGDGFLLYPDLTGELLPLPSVRMELTRDGIEDYDLLTLLQRRVREVKRSLSLYDHFRDSIPRAMELLDVDALVPSALDYEKNPARYEAAHQALLEALDSLGA